MREVKLGGYTPPEKICRSKSTNQSGERKERLPDLCFSICRFSQVVFIPRAQPHAQSLFLFPIVFGINLIHFSMRRRTVQPEIRSFVLLLRSPVTPFDRSKTKNANCFEERHVFGKGKCELSALQEGLRCKILARKSAKLFANTKVEIFGKERCKIHCQFQSYWGDVTSVSLSLSLSLSLSVSLFLTERTSRTI